MTKYTYQPIRPSVTYLPYRGMWEATKGDNTEVFYSQSEAERFAGVEYDREADGIYWRTQFPSHFN